MRFTENERQRYWTLRFNSEIPYGRSYDVIDEMPKHDRVLFETDFSDELVDSEAFEEKFAEIEKKFDEEVEAHRKGWQISQQCRNFLNALRKSYIRVNIVKKVVEKFNPRETAIVWATWKGLARRKYYPKG